ncbi:MAG: hypothetical protein AAF526_02035 [Pseudomonadota bacterium]
MRGAHGTVDRVSDREGATHRARVRFGKIYEWIGAATDHRSAWGHAAIMASWLAGAPSEEVRATAELELVDADRIGREGDQINAKRIRANADQMQRCATHEMVAAHRAREGASA